MNTDDDGSATVETRPMTDPPGVFSPAWPPHKPNPPNSAVTPPGFETAGGGKGEADADSRSSRVQREELSESSEVNPAVVDAFGPLPQFPDEPAVKLGLDSVDDTTPSTPPPPGVEEEEPAQAQKSSATEETSAAEEASDTEGPVVEVTETEWGVRLATADRRYEAVDSEGAAVVTEFDAETPVATVVLGADDREAVANALGAGSAPADRPVDVLCVDDLGTGVDVHELARGARELAPAAVIWPGAADPENQRLLKGLLDGIDELDGTSLHEAVEGGELAVPDSNLTVQILSPYGEQTPPSWGAPGDPDRLSANVRLGDGGDYAHVVDGTWEFARKSFRARFADDAPPEMVGSDLPEEAQSMVEKLAERNAETSEGETRQEHEG